MIKYSFRGVLISPHEKVYVEGRWKSSRMKAAPEIMSKRNEREKIMANSCISKLDRIGMRLREKNIIPLWFLEDVISILLSCQQEVTLVQLLTHDDRLFLGQHGEALLQVVRGVEGTA